MGAPSDVKPRLLFIHFMRHRSPLSTRQFPETESYLHTHSFVHSYDSYKYLQHCDCFARSRAQDKLKTAHNSLESYSMYNCVPGRDGMCSLRNVKKLSRDQRKITSGERREGREEGKPETASWRRRHLNCLQGERIATGRGVPIPSAGWSRSSPLPCTRCPSSAGLTCLITQGTAPHTKLLETSVIPASSSLKPQEGPVHTCLAALETSPYSPGCRPH